MLRYMYTANTKVFLYTKNWTLNINFGKLGMWFLSKGIAASVARWHFSSMTQKGSLEYSLMPKTDSEFLVLERRMF